MGTRVPAPPTFLGAWCCGQAVSPRLTAAFLPLQLGEGLGAKETPQQRYQRLQHEVQELFREVEQIQVSVAPALGSGGEAVPGGG